MEISNLINGLKNVIIKGENRNINNLTFNTSTIINGSLFFCIEGVKVDGHTFAQRAIDSGAEAIVINRDLKVNGNVSKIIVEDTREAMAIISSNFYNNPSKDMDMVGITGTNGKTTSTFMLKSILDNFGKITGLLGTMYNISGKNIEEAKRTTPESMDLQNMLNEMKNNNVNVCIMEVSSHSLELKRVYGVNFKVGIFTNLTQDHLDFHNNMENYFEAKMKLFSNCDISVINADDEYGKKAIKRISSKLITYGIENEADVFAKDLIITEDGTQFTLGYIDQLVPIKLNLPGKFNVYNALGCTAAAISMGIPIEIIKLGLQAIEKIPGRSEKINTNKGFTIILDYAHSPDGIINILKTAREYTRGKLITLFGCGGDRDTTKRSLMGKAAGELSDFCVVTSDNPRSEDPSKIIEDIIPGIKATNCPYVIIENRKEAIKYAICNAKKGDVVIMAGKGHETYQILADKTIHFDEREIISELLKEDF